MIKSIQSNTKQILLTVSMSILLSACNDHSQQTPPPQMAMPPMPVSVLTVQPTDVPIQAEAVAQTQGAKEIEIRPRVGGIVLKRLFAEGAEIKAGQAMFLIDPVPFEMKVKQARAQYAQQQAHVAQTKRESDRLKMLLATKSISQREYDNASSENAMADATALQYEAILHEAELNLSYATVKAPEGGMAGRFLFSEGALVNANTSLLTTITQTSPIWVRFSLSDSELIELGGMLTDKSAQKIELLLPDGSRYPESGKLNFSASNIDPTLGTQQLRAEFKNADKRLIPGQFVRIRVTTGSHEGVFLVPQTAVLTGEQGKFVFVATPGDDDSMVANVRPVKVGEWRGENWIVLAGLQQGDQVIIDNLIKVRPGAKVMPKDTAETKAISAEPTIKATTEGQ